MQYIQGHRPGILHTLSPVGYKVLMLITFMGNPIRVCIV